MVKHSKNLMCNHMIILFVISLFLHLLTAQWVRKELLNHPNWSLLDRGLRCGPSSNVRIIGGKRASLGQYPWIARLGYKVTPSMTSQNELVYACGGSVISERYVISAAHCCPPHFQGVPYGVTVNLVQVRLGEFDNRTNPDCEDGICAPPVQDLDVESTVTPKHYKPPPKYHNDICLIRVVDHISFNAFVYPVCLPVYDWFTHNSFETLIMEVAGWGDVDAVEQIKSNVLMTVNVPVVSNRNCMLAYRGRSTITGSQLCAGGEIGRDSCSGDSGGPLVTPLSLGGPPRYFQLGIVSYGETLCASARVPGVYTRLSAYLIWILNNVKE